MSGPMFSVVIPWHGNPDHLARAVASVRTQTFRDYEIVVACNGPAADRRDAMAADPDYGDVRFVVSPPPDASRARNAGADAARSEWIAFLDVDDRFLPGKLMAMAEAAAAGGAVLLCSRGYRVRAAGMRALYPPQLLGESENPGEFFFARGANFSGSSIVVRRDVGVSVRFTDDLKTFEDNDFVMRVHAAGGAVRMLPEPLYEWWDDRDTGRLSRSRDFDAQMAWARSLGPVFSERAFCGFMARCIAQHLFPARPLFCLGAFYRGWRHGGLSAATVLQFAVRGLLPSPAVKWLMDRRIAREGAKVEAGA